ncbi:MAG: TetR/AcrR family transcriptional regulator [Putridiphycobacter sp.]
MKKEIILETTLNLIAKNGLSGSPMSQIAKASGVATGTIYHHFKSKEEIINAIYLSKKKDFGNILANYQQLDASFKTKFYGIWEAFYDYFVENPLIFHFTQQISFSPIITPEVKAEGESHYAYIYELFELAKKNKEVIDMDVNVMVQMVFGNILSLVELNQKGLKITKKTKQQAMDYSWRAVKK